MIEKGAFIRPEFNIGGIKFTVPMNKFEEAYAVEQQRESALNFLRIKNKVEYSLSYSLHLEPNDVLIGIGYTLLYGLNASAFGVGGRSVYLIAIEKGILNPFVSETSPDSTIVRVQGMNLKTSNLYKIPNRAETLTKLRAVQMLANT